MGHGNPSYEPTSNAHPFLLESKEQSGNLLEIGRGFPFRRILCITPLYPLDAPDKRCTSSHALKHTHTPDDRTTPFSE
jgi:hypothetical protein